MRQLKKTAIKESSAIPVAVHMISSQKFEALYRKLVRCCFGKANVQPRRSSEKYTFSYDYNRYSKIMSINSGFSVLVFRR